MDELHSWPQRIAEREGDYLTPEDLQDLIRYSLSFQERLDLYQVLRQQESVWIQEILQQRGYPPNADLPPLACLLARQLAFCLRALGLSLLLGDPLPLQQWIWGAMEQYLELPEAIRQLRAVVQGSLSTEQQDLLTPYWQQLQATYPAPAAHPEPELTSDEVESPPEQAPTLAEMFV